MMYANTNNANIANLGVSATILGQLGGSRFLAMTGATNLLGASDSLTMKLPRGATKDGITHLRVTLEPSDLYRCEWLHITKHAIVEVAADAGIYGDRLQALFTKRTGLDVSL